MTQYEYKVVPAPTKGVKAAGVKSAEGRFANAIQGLLNTQASEGWEYLRSDMLPSDERQGLTSTQTVYRTLLVFRRAVAPVDSPAETAITQAAVIAEAVEVDHDDVAPQESEPAPETPPEQPKDKPQVD